MQTERENNQRSRDLLERWIGQIEKVIAGKRLLIERVILACLCEGHVLLEDVPGVGKTTLVSVLASTIGGSFKRIQFTPDQLPSDITGISAYHPQTMEFNYRPGPLMANIVLADEINRASPRTQSALLEAMEERSVTVDGLTHRLPQPFFLLATQNPLRHEGTYPLPEAQMDRFLFQLRLGYPQREQEVELLERVRVSHPMEQVEIVLTVEELIELQQQVRVVYVDSSLKRYIVSLAEVTRNHSDIELGASPRASIALMRAAQGRAWMQGRDYVIPDDVKILAAAVFSHRLVMRAETRINHNDRESFLAALLNKVLVPTVSRDTIVVSEKSLMNKGWFR